MPKIKVSPQKTSNVPSNNSSPSTSTNKETLSIIVIVLVGLTTVLTVLLVNEKRNSLNLQSKLAAAPQSIIEKEISTIPAITPPAKPFSEQIELPEPVTDSGVSIEEALQTRRSQRVFIDEALSLKETSQMLWAAQGITDENGHRTAPSARSLYPYTVYLVARNIEGLKPGMYQYLPESHSLGNVNIPDAGQRLIDGGVQEAAQTSPAVIVLSAAIGKMVERFPDDPVGVTFLEGGHIGQNLYLQSQSLELGMVVMAGFDPKLVGKSIDLHESETVVYVIPIGIPELETAIED